MSIRIAHLCEKAFNGGALASLKQIRMGIAGKKPDWNQHVIVACKKDPKSYNNPIYFEKDAIYVNYETLNKYLHNYDLVFIHKLMNTNVGRMISYIPRSKCKIVVISHTFSVNASNCMVGRPDLCICVSDYMVKNFKKYNPKIRFARIHNAVSSKWIDKNGFKSGLVRNGVIGRANTLNLIKYSKKFTEWFSSTDFGRPFTMEYLGGGSIIDEARNYAMAQKNINSIDFKGNVENDSVRYGMMSSWEFFLYDINLPEGTSMAVLESLAMGIPVICSNKPGNNEIIIPGENGYTFSNLDEATQILRNLISNNKIEQLRSSCAKIAESDMRFNDMSNSYVEEINSLFSRSSDHANKHNKGHLYVENINIKDNAMNNKKDFIIRSNRKTAFPSHNDIKINKINKIDKTNKIDKKNKDIRDLKKDSNKKINKQKPEKVVVDLNKSAKENMNVKNKPIASDVFVEDVMRNLEKADKVFSGPKFTIITAGFDKGKYIDDWFNSILKQTYRPLEVVYVDDKSNDNTEELVNNLKDSFLKNGIDFVYIRNESQIGCAKSYKKALLSASGDYFGVLDADDAIMPEAVGIVMSKYLSDQKISFIWSKYIRCNHDMSMVGTGISRGVPVRPPRSMLEFESHTRRTHCYSHWRTMKRMENMEKVFECPYPSSVDKFMGYMLEEMGHGHFLNLHLYMYRGSVSDGLTATSAQRSNWSKIREDAKRRRNRTRKKIYRIIQ